MALTAAMIFSACAGRISSPTLAASLNSATTPAVSPTASHAPTPFLFAPTVGAASTSTVAMDSAGAGMVAPSVSPSPVPASVVPSASVLVAGLSSPDDLLLAPDGSLFVSDVGDGKVRRLDPSGNLSAVLSGLVEPEGMAFLPDGSLLVVEQGKNRILRYDFTAKRLAPFLALRNPSGKLGVDEILFDRLKGSLLIPDSPNGNILRLPVGPGAVSTDQSQAAVIASGFARPTGIAIAPDDSLLVADENGSALFRIPAGGVSKVLVARMPVPDDVIIATDGTIYVNTLYEGAIHRIDAATGRDEIWFRGLSLPQGIAFDGQGNIVVAEAGKHRLVKIGLP